MKFDQEQSGSTFGINQSISPSFNQGFNQRFSQGLTKGFIQGFTRGFTQGFTLVELIIVVAIIGVLAALALPSYTQMVQNSRIKTAAESIQNGLQVARAEAVKRNAPVQFDLRGGDSAWTVCVAPAAGACPNPDDGDTIQSRSAGEGSSADIDVTFTNAGPYVFTSLGVSAPTALFTIDNSAISAADSRELQVILGAGGSVKICDPSVDTAGTDPRRCPV